MVVKCFRCGIERYKCRECPLWVKKERVARVAMPQKVQQERRPARSVRGEAQATATPLPAYVMEF